MASWDSVNRLFRELSQLKKETEMALAEIQNLETWLENSSPRTVEMDVEGKMGRLKALYSEERDRAMKEESLLNKTILEMDAITLLDKESENRKEDDTKEKNPPA